ncbi:hypothetical protein CAPTEDRAFT_199246 [Capitella teleta]|uniref:Uncharacterized protein n=1 Tax=Capitella teleta TaxID=283909 RepID=R7UCF1_CAPTE|nr:hypothetical protein CAPTEDRAFT_199246 [Capitella teleta]|eukprot:ELU03801.1 hypothetical protein CAPTEDRAFT_199246 [Capitella teleta]
MHRQSTIDIPPRSKDRNIFKRAVSKVVELEPKSPKSDNGKMVRNIYRQPISRSKGNVTIADRSVLGETRRKHFAGAHLNQIWSSDPRDFRSHPAANRSDDSDLTRGGRAHSPISPRMTSSRRSSSVPDVPFMAPAPEAHSPSRRRSKHDEDEAQFIFYETKKKPQNVLPLTKMNSTGGSELKPPVSPSLSPDPPRSPLYRMLYKTTRHLSHDPASEVADRAAFSQSVDFSNVTQTFRETLKIEGSPKNSPEKAKKQHVMLKTCDFELYDLPDPSPRFRKGLRIIVEIEDVFLGCKTTVKALSGGNTILIVISSSTNNNPETGSSNESVERVHLPVTVDSFAVKARVPRPGQLIIEAPMRHMRSTSDEQSAQA